MTTTEVKKALYKQKPIANYVGYEDESLIYEASLNDGTVIHFEIPYEESRTEDNIAIFQKEEPAQLLIRWIKK